MQLKAGFPPKEVSGSETDPVVQLGITSGSAVTVLEQKAAPPAAAPAAPIATATPALPSPPPPKSNFATASAPTPPIASAPVYASPESHSGSSAEMVQSLVDMGFPQDYATRALEAAGGDIHTALEICMGGDPLAFMSQGVGEATGEGAQFFRVFWRPTCCNDEC